MAGVNWSNVPMLTNGMENLGNQFNDRWPTRSGTSDGAIGDYAHSQGTSGHNPDDTTHDNAEWDSDSDTKKEVRAIDVDKDLNDPRGADMQDVIDHMRKLPGLKNVIRYMIFNKKIYRASNDFEPEVYTGGSTHTEHAHFSGAYTNASDENTSFDFKFEELGVRVATQFNAEDQTILRAKATEGVLSYAAGGRPVSGDPAFIAAGSNILAYFTQMANQVAALTAAVETLQDSANANGASLAVIQEIVQDLEQDPGDGGPSTVQIALRDAIWTRSERTLTA